MSFPWILVRNISHNPNQSIFILMKLLALLIAVTCDNYWEIRGKDKESAYIFKIYIFYVSIISLLWLILSIIVFRYLRSNCTLKVYLLRKQKSESKHNLVVKHLLF